MTTTRILALDLETDGANPATCRIVEIGFACWDFQRATPLAVYDGLVWDKAEGAPPMTAENMAIHGITNEDREAGGKPMAVHLAALAEAIETWKPTRLVTHNGRGFDTPILARHTPGMHPVFSLGQFDTKRDVPGITGRLAHLLADHAKLVNPFAHRALFDALGCCLYLQALQDKMGPAYGFDHLCWRLDAPQVLFQSTQGRDRLGDAKRIGFAFDWDKREWRQSVPDFEVAELEARAAAANVPIRRVR